MSDFVLTTPVAFIIFNRPDTTERVFAEIAKAKPTKLLVVADGARQHKEGEAEKVAATRAIIKRVDWDCEVLNNYSDVNLGCKNRVSSGIDWIFQQVEEAIILEDDCLPDPTFFRFCQEMLERYRDDQRIGMISGDNFQLGKRRNQDSYYFSKYVHIWGWATWRDRWQNSYDVELSKWPTIKEQQLLKSMLRSSNESKYWSKIFENIYNGNIDTWDYQWMFAIWVEGQITVLPTINLVSNIGFSIEATHTTNNSILANLAVQELKFPLKHPNYMFCDIEADMYTYKSHIKTSVYKSAYQFYLMLFKGNKISSETYL